jgi:hypothetical protein
MCINSAYTAQKTFHLYYKDEISTSPTGTRIYSMGKIEGFLC